MHCLWLWYPSYIRFGADNSFYSVHFAADSYIVAVAAVVVAFESVAFVVVDSKSVFVGELAFLSDVVVR